MASIVKRLRAIIISLVCTVSLLPVKVAAAETVQIMLNMDPITWYTEDGDQYCNDYYRLPIGTSFNENPTVRDSIRRFPTSHELIGFYNAQTQEIIELSDFYDYKFNASVSLNAIWDGYEHTVTFKNNNGYFNDDPELTQFSVTVPFWKPLSSVLRYAPFPNMKDSSFDFWRFSHTDLEDYTPLGIHFVNSIVKLDYTVEPSWKSGSGTDYYVVSYEPEGGYFTDTNDDSAHMKEFIPQNFWGSLSAPEVRRDGYALLGWSEEQDCADSACLYTNSSYGFQTSRINHVYAIWKKAYTVTWLNADGTVLETDEEVMEGETPSYDGETPTMPDDNNRYTFTGWTPEISEVTGDITYTAVYDTVSLLHTVTWVNYDGTVLEVDENVHEGVVPEYNGETPIKPAEEQYIYTFTGWEPEVSALGDSDITYTAQFFKDSTIASDIYWADGDEIEAMELVGGTEENPVTVTVGGTVTIKGMVNVVSGYVNFIAEEGKEAKLINTQSSNQPMIQIGGKPKVRIEGIALEGNGQNNGISDGNGNQGYSLDIINCSIKGFNNGLYMYADWLVTVRVNGTVITDCEYGLFGSKGIFEFIDSEIKNNTYGIGLGQSGKLSLSDTVVTGNKYGVSYYNSYSGGDVSGNVVVKDNEEWDLSKNGSSNVLQIKGALSGEINITDCALNVGETVIAQPYSGYTITETDVQAIHYIPTKSQLSGLIISEPYLNSDGNVVVNVTSSNYYWADGDEIEAMELVGGTEENPVTVTVGGTVTIKGMVNVVSGYVNFIAEEGKEAKLINTQSSNQPMIQIGGKPKVRIEGIALEGNGQNNGISDGNGNQGYSLDIINCSIKGFNNGLYMYADWLVTVRVNGTVITDCEYGLFGSKGIFEFIDSEIKNNTYGIGLGQSGKLSLSDTVVTGNKYGVSYYNSYSGGDVSGNVVVKDNEEWDLSKNGSSNVLQIKGALSGEINITDCALNVGETVIAKPYTGYTITEADV